MLSLRLALRALRWRGAASVTVFMVALVGITAAAVGPIYLHAVDETVLTNRLLKAPQTQRDLRIERNTTIGLTGINWHVAILSLGTQAVDPRYFDAPVYSEEAPVEWSGLTRYASEFAAIDGLCTARAGGGGHLPVVHERARHGRHAAHGDAAAPVGRSGDRAGAVRDDLSRTSEDRGHRRAAPAARRVLGTVELPQRGELDLRHTAPAAGRVLRQPLHALLAAARDRADR